MIDEDDSAGERPSKSALKRESQALQDLGEELIELPDTIVNRLDLPEQLRDAILQARRITSHGALFRQRQFIGKLMRKLDAAPIREAIDQYRLRQQSGGARFHQVEEWRDRLVREGAAAIPALQAAVPAIDVAEIGMLLSAVQRAHDEHTRKASARALFRYVDRKWGHSPFST